MTRPRRDHNEPPRSPILPLLTIALFVLSGLPLLFGSGPGAAIAPRGLGDPAAHPSPSALLGPALSPHPSGTNLTAGWSQLFQNLTRSPDPGGRDMAALAYDADWRGDILFGGYTPDGSSPYGGLALGDTWILWNDTWHNISASLGQGPSPRWGARMVWDEHAQELVLFGGRNFTQFFNDTWTLNATSWHQVATPVAPSPRNLFQFTYDPFDALDLLYGGWHVNLTSGIGNVLGETWAFQGNRWTNLTGTVGAAPGPREDGSLLALSATGVLRLYGGVTQAPSGGTCSTTAGQYNFTLGSGWTPFNLTYGLPTVFGLGSTALNFSGADAFYFGGATGSSGCPGTNGTFAHTPPGWVNLTSVSSVNPMARAETSITYDAGAQQVVLFGGVAAGSNYLGDTWVWGPIGPNARNGTGGGGSGGGGNNSSALQPGWNDLWNLSSSPSLRDMSSMAYDPDLGEIVLFGGYDPSILPLGDTWTFVHDQWTFQPAANISSMPAPRWGARMIWDPAMQSLVLFGGRNLTQFFNDTWTYNASGWHQWPTVRAPSPRGFFEFTYDAGDGYAILYGGGHGNVPAGSGSTWQIQTDTWNFSHGVWNNLTGTVSGSPSPTIDAAMAYDPVSGEAIRLGGSLTGHPAGACTPVSNESAYRGAAWVSLNNSNATPPALAGESMAWDNATASIVLFGGTVPGGGLCPGIDATWSWSAGVWTNLTGNGTLSAPSGRSESTMAYDEADQQLVLFGGVSTTQGYVGDTWVWTGPSSRTNGSGNGGGGNGSGGNGSGGGPSGQPLGAEGTESTSQGVLPLEVQFAVTPTGGSAPYTFTWNFGDGPAVSGTPAMTHLYLAAGAYDPSVLLTDSSGHSHTVNFPTVNVLSNLPDHGVPPIAVSGPGPASYLVLIGLGAVVGGLLCGGVLAVLLRGRRLQEEGEELVRPAPPGGPR